MSLERRMLIYYSPDGNGGGDESAIGVNLNVSADRPKPKYSAGDVAKLTAKLRADGNALKGYEKKWKGALEGGNFLGRAIKYPVKLVAKIVPDRLGGSYLEEKLEGDNPLEIIEKNSRAYLNGIEETLLMLGEIAKQKREEARVTREKLTEAKTNNWGIKELRDHIQKEANMDASEQMQDILDFADEQVAALGQAEVDRKRNSLLTLLENKALVQDELVKLLGTATTQGAETYQMALMQYASFIALSDGLQGYREAALHVASSEVAALDTKELFKGMLEKITALNETAIDSLSILERNLVASPEVAEQIKAANDKIRLKLDAHLSGNNVKTEKVNSSRVRV